MEDNDASIVETAYSGYARRARHRQRRL